MDVKLRHQIESERAAGIAAVQRLQLENERLRTALQTIYHQANGAHPTEWGLCIGAIESRARAALTPNVELTGAARLHRAASSD